MNLTLAYTRNDITFYHGCLNRPKAMKNFNKCELTKFNVKAGTPQNDAKEKTTRLNVDYVYLLI